MMETLAGARPDHGTRSDLGFSVFEEKDSANVAYRQHPAFTLENLGFTLAIGWQTEGRP
jgi:hypothetical protein